MGYVYILQCSDGTLYVGSTSDIEKRVHEHNHRKSGAHYTKIRRPVILVYQEVYTTLSEARKREHVIKRMSREQKLFLVHSNKDTRVIMKSFKENVIEVVKQIPKGSVMTYGEVAARSGNAKAFRVVGSIMANNSDTEVPCHRVVRSDGSIGEYNGLQGKSKKEILLREGVTFKDDVKVFI